MMLFAENTGYGRQREVSVAGDRPDRSRFAAKLRSLRDFKWHITQETLAEVSGVDINLIRNYEQEKSLAKGETLEKLAEALGTTTGAFEACALRSMELLPQDAQNRLAAQLLFQLAGTYDLAPYASPDYAGVRAKSGYFEYAMTMWCEMREADERDTAAATESGLSPEEYGELQDRMVATFRQLSEFEIAYDGPYDPADYPAAPPTLGETLKRLRRASGLTQEGLAEAAEVSLPAICAYEQGKRTPTDEQRQAMAKALGVPEEVLTDFGIYDPNTGWHFLMELAQIYGMRPVREGKLIVLTHIGRTKPLDPFFREWAERFETHIVRGFGDGYEDWKDHYEG